MNQLEVATRERWRALGCSITLLADTDTVSIYERASGCVIGRCRPDVLDTYESVYRLGGREALQAYANEETDPAWKRAAEACRSTYKRSFPRRPTSFAVVDDCVLITADGKSREVVVVQDHDIDKLIGALMMLRPKSAVVSIEWLDKLIKDAEAGE